MDGQGEGLLIFGKTVETYSGGGRERQRGWYHSDQDVENMVRNIVCNTCNKPVGSSEEWLIHIHQSARKEGSGEKHHLMCLCCEEVFQSFKLFRLHILSTGHVTPGREDAPISSKDLSTSLRPSRPDLVRVGTGFNGETVAFTSTSRERNTHRENGEETAEDNGDYWAKAGGEEEEKGCGDSDDNNKLKRENYRFQREPSIFGRMQAISGPQDGTFLKRHLEIERRGRMFLVEDPGLEIELQKLPAKHLNSGVGSVDFGGELAYECDS